MIAYIEYLQAPAAWGAIAIAVLAGMNFIGEVMEFKGKVAPEILKMRKYFARKKRERQTLAELPETLAEVKQSLATMNSHYNADNISKRDHWMQSVDSKQEQDHKWIESLSEILSQIQTTVLSIRIENMRSEIIAFSSIVIDPEAPVTRDQFDRILRLHADYERILKDNDMTNGETTIAMHIIIEAYEDRMRRHAFFEDVKYGHHE